MFTICTDFVPNGKLEDYLKNLSKSEKKFNKEIGVLFRKFFQCKVQPHIIWAITEWINGKAHHDAAQSILKTRRDDRFASVGFGPEPYFEIFCKNEEAFSVGNYSDLYGIFIVIHALINDKVQDKYLGLRKERFEEVKKKLCWMRVFHNISNNSEFVAFLGFTNEEQYNQSRQLGDFYLEEYLFTGIEKPLGMSYIANYNQFICKLLTPI
ncbi:MAG: hypothetical protein ACFE8V_16160 [Promethearchaeota archaeon]